MKSLKEVLNNSIYREKLNSEQWRSFSRATRQRKGGGCEMCRRTNLETQIHHISYDPAREPWEYGDDEVVLLCRGCHKEIHVQLQNFRKFVFGKMTPRVFQVLNGALAVAFEQFDPLVFAHALAEFVATPSMVERYAKSFGTTASPKQERPYIPHDPVVLARAKMHNKEL